MSEALVYIRISEKVGLPAINKYRPFRAVVVLDAEYSDQWQDQVSRWLVDSGCLYMMAWGPGCSSWDDSVDYAQIQKYPNGAPEADFVMTTWHEEETLESVFWFSRFCAHDPYDVIEHSLIVHVGNTDREAEFLILYAQAETSIDPDDEQS